MRSSNKWPNTALDDIDSAKITGKLLFERIRRFFLGSIN